jgi:hypothetical protein
MVRALGPCIRAFAAAALCCAGWTHGAALGPHEHGVVRLDIAVEPGRLTILLDSPLDNLIGFEHAPRSADEQRRADAAIAGLKDEASLFRIDPAAQCRPGPVELSSAALKLGTPDASDAAAGHADIDGTYTFVCAQAGQARHIDVDLLGAFPRIQRIDVQAATPRGEFKRTLRRPDRRIELHA